MTPIAINIKPSDRLSMAVKLMQKNLHSCLVVVDNEYPVGIITERDIVRVFSEMIEKNIIDDRKLDELMSKDIVIVEDNSSLYNGLELAWKKKLRHLPVVNGTGKLVGLVTQTDMIRSYASIFEKQVELENANQKLQLLSHEDALLGIGNRRAMESGLNFAEASAIRLNSTYTIALFDVDFFKKYNDYYGHQAGDKALQRITAAMKNNLRDSDQLYRYGGEEFLLLMPNTDIKEAMVGVERIRKAIELLKDPHVKSPYNILTVSVGVSAMFAGCWGEMIKCADNALYKAKGTGRNKMCYVK